MTISEQESTRPDAVADAEPPRPRRRFSWSGFAAGLLLGVLLLVLWFGITGVLALREAQALRDSADALQSAAADGDFQAAASQLQQAREHAASLNGRLATVPLSWTQSMPVIGSTVSAGAALVDATDAVLEASAGLEAGFADTTSGADLVGVSLALQQAGGQLERAGQVAATAALQVASIDPGSVLAPVRPQFSAVQAQLLAAMQGLSDGASLARVLPDLLGVTEPKSWLVVLSQPSEARGSGGGFYGAYQTLTVSGGRFTLGEAAANGPETAVVQDLSRLPVEYRRLWGSDATYLWGFNLSRHYPYTAPVIQRALDPGADYVVSIGPRAVAGLLSLSGPVTVDGVTIDAGNAEMFFSRDIYTRYPDDWTKKDEVTLEALRKVFLALEGREGLTPADWWAALGPAVGSGHVQVWSPDPAIEPALEASLLGGAVPSLSAPWVTVAFNNSAGNKIDSFVRSEVTYTATGSCEDGVADGSVVAELGIDPLPPGLPGYISGRNDEPAAPYGTTSMLVHVYGPSGAVGVGSVRVDGQPVPVMAGMERGHPVWGVKVQLSPEAPVRVEVDFEQPAFPGQPLEVAPQPMVQDSVVRVVDDRSCGLPTS